MSFNGSGTWVPPAGQPVASGTVIQSTTHNTLITDIGNSFNNTLPRDGQAPMQGQLKITDGTSSIPGIAFNSEASSGIYRPTLGALALVASGIESLRINSAGRVMIGTMTDDGSNKLQVDGTAKISGAATLGSTLGVSGATTLATLGVTGAATVGATLNVTGAASAALFNGPLNGNVSGNLTGNVTGTLNGNVIGNVAGTLTGNVIGNASTATKLQTTRTINGTAFDGTANIVLETPRSGADGTSYQLPGGYNLNNLTHTGFYRGTELVNAPAGNGGWFWIVHEQHDGEWAKQTATTFGSGNSRNQTYQRVKSAGGWSDWLLTVDGDYGTDFAIKKRRPSAASETNTLSMLNHAETGFAYSSSGHAPTNGPYIHFGGLGGSGDYGCQIQANYQNSSDIYFRTKNDDTRVWNEWTSIWNAKNLNPQTAAVGYSVVQRNASGYILGNYINMSDDGNGAANNVPITSIIAKKGDDYYRSSSAQQVKDFLNLGNLGIKSLPGGTDLNTLIQPGMYPIKGNPVNGPNGGAAFNSLLVFGNGDHDVVTQLYGDFASSKLFTRSGNNFGTTWAPWRRLAWSDYDTLLKPTIQGYIEKLQSLSSGVGGSTLYPDNGTLIEVTVTANTTITLPAAVAGLSYTVIVAYQGAFTVTFTCPTGIRWAGGAAPATTSSNGKFDKYVFTCGANYVLGQDGGRSF